uniref:Uncharacterized protein n=1 Tax=Bicosoecida sp. CB-2014 TaxID=1486930 RepID=A0A7S1G5Y0_9STRA
MGNTGVPGETMSAAAVRMEVVAVNDAPTITLPPESARTTAEDATLDLGALRIGDVDAGADDVTVELSVEHGSIAVLSTQPPRGQTAVSLTDTLIELNDALSTLWYLPDVDWHGVDVLTVTVRDNSWAGVGGPQETTRVMRVVTTAVNDAPYVRLFEPSQTTDEDTPLAVAGVEVDDTDVDEYENTMALMDVTVTAARGRPSVAAVVHGVVATTDAGTADGDGDDAGRVLRLRGTRDALNSALRTLVFTPDAHATGAAALTVAVNDLGNTGAGGALSATATIDIAVAAVEDAPDLLLPAAVVVTEDEDNVYGQLVDFGLRDRDGAPANLLVLRVWTGSGRGALTLDPTVLDDVRLLAQGVWPHGGDKFAMMGSPADADAALRSLRFATDSDTAAEDFLHVATYYLSDDAWAAADLADAIDAGDVDILGGTLPVASTATVRLELQPRNDAPTVVVAAPTVTVAEDTPLIDAGIRVVDSDVDHNAERLGSVEVALSASVGAVALDDAVGLYAIGSADIDQRGVGARVGADGVHRWFDELAWLEERAWAWRPSDLVDPDVADTDAAALEFIESQSSVVVARGTISVVNAALAGLVYVPPRDWSGTATITITVNDLGEFGLPHGPTATTRSVSVEVTSVNDPPVISRPLLTPANPEGEDIAIEVVVDGIRIDDVDIGPVGVFAVRLAVSHGRLALASRDGLSFAFESAAGNLTGVGRGNNDRVVAFRGLAADVNRALRIVTYTPDEDFAGADQLTMHVEDEGSSGDDGGGARWASVVVDLDIGAVNTAPQLFVPPAGDAPLELQEDTPISVGDVVGLIDVDADDTPGGMVEATVTASHAGTLEVQRIRTSAAVVDPVQVLTVQDSDVGIGGSFRVSLDLQPWGGDAATSDAILANAVGSVAQEVRGNPGTGADAGESVEAAILALANIGDVVVDVKRTPIREGGAGSDVLGWSHTITFYNAPHYWPVLTAASDDADPLTGTDPTVDVVDDCYRCFRGNAVGGTFTVGYGGFASRPVPHDATPYAMQAALESLPVHLRVAVTRSQPTLQDAYAWTITFFDAPPAESLELIAVDGTSLTGKDADVTTSRLVDGVGRPELHVIRTFASHRDEVQTVTTLADSPLSGHFSLGLDLSWLGDGGGGDVGAAVTGRIDHAALPQTADERLTHEPGSNLGESMQTHINALLARLADEATEGPARDMVARMSVDVTRDDRPPNGGFVWSITFHNAPFDLTPLSVEDTSGLEGDGAAVWIDTVVQGNGLGGDDGATRVDPAGTGVQTFTLLDDSPGFAGGWTLTLVTDHVETTTAIDAHAVAMTADEAADKLGSSMESKLRTLPSVRHKAFFVTREAVLSDPGDDVLGYVWTVTFFDWPTEWPVLVPRLVNVVGDEPRVSASPVMTGTEIQTFTLRDTAPGFSGGWTLALDLQLWEGEIETSALIDAAAVPATADEVNGGGVGLDIGESLESKLRALPNFGAMELDVSRSEIRTDPGGGGGSGDLIGYTWTVTFHNAPRHLPTLLPQRTTLVGTDPNLHIKARTVLHASHGAPGGTFTVTLDGDETEPLAFDATAAEVRGAILALPSAIAADLGLGSVAVARWPRDREGGHAWYVAITEENDNAALAMAANGAGLSHAAVGASASMTLVHRGGVRGVFTLAHEGMLAARVLRADGTDVTTRGASSEGLGRLRVTGTVADVATALRHVMYTPTLDWHGRVTVAVRVRDMGNTGVPGETMSAAAVRMEVVAVNDAPTITLPPESARTTAEDATLDLGALRIGDVDAGADDVTVELSVEHGSIAVLSTQPPRGQTAASPSPSPSPSPPAAAPRASTTRAAHSSHTRCRHGSSATLRARSEQMAHLSDVAGADPSSPPPSSSSSSSAAAPAPAAPAHSGRARMARSAAITCPTLQRRSRS